MIRVGRCVVKSYCLNWPYFWGDFLGEGVKDSICVENLDLAPKMTSTIWILFGLSPYYTITYYHIIIISYYHIFIPSYYHTIILSYYHIIKSSSHHISISSYSTHTIISSKRQMVEVIFGAKSRISTHIESFTPPPRKSPQK